MHSRSITGLENNALRDRTGEPRNYHIVSLDRTLFYIKCRLLRILSSEGFSNQFQGKHVIWNLCTLRPYI